MSFVFVVPKRPKRPIIHVIAAIPSPKKVKSIDGVPFEFDSPDLFMRYTQSKAPSYIMVSHTYNTRRNKKIDDHSNTS